jgi:hypothetical protein
MSCPGFLTAVRSAAPEADAQIVDRFAVIHFTFIVFFTPRLVVSLYCLICAQLYNVQQTQFVSANRQMQAVLDNRGRPCESGSLAGACTG